MKRRWQVSALCIATLLHAHIASAGIPFFPSEDDFTVLDAKSKPVKKDVSNDDQTELLQITHLRIRSEIALRYARTAIVSKVHNPSSLPQQATFQVIIPETAFISGFSMTINNETYEAFVKPKEEAKQVFEAAVSRGDSAGHVAAEARDSNNYRIEVVLEPNADATYLLNYEEMLVRRNKGYNYVINMLPGGLVPKMDVIVHIKESQKISKLRIPELRTGHEVDATEKDKQYSKAVIKRSRNGREATITFTPDIEEQKRLAEIYEEKAKKSKDPYSAHIGFNSDEDEDENENQGVLGQFVVQYDVEQPKNGEILVNDGYFLHLLAPSSLPPLSKYVVFVLDTSGSMAGDKIVQLHKAMNAILSDLHPNDYFSIVEFNSAITIHDLEDAYKPPKPIKAYYNYNPSTAPIIPVPPSIASPINIDAAKIIVSRLVANGGTNINTALQEALKLTQTGVYDKNQASSVDNGNKKKDLESIIIFLTDGEPTVGVTNTEHIIAYLTEKNSAERRVPVFSLAFGDDADRVFLRKLSLQNEGFMRHIYAASDAALQLHDFYKQVSSPVLSNVTFLYPSRQIKEKSITRTHFHTINDGSEVAVLGKIADGINEITPQIFGLRSDDNGEGRKTYEVSPKVPVTSEKDKYLPLERFWAYLTIKQLLDKHDAGNGPNDGSSGEENPEQKALAIALQYSFVTPLTSLVVVRLNETDDLERVDVDRVDDPDYLRRARTATRDAPATLAKLESQSTGGELTVNTNDGPLLYAQSTRRLSNDGLRRRDQSSTSPPPASSTGQKHFARGNPDQWGPDPNAKLYKYHLKYMQWTLPLINSDDDTLVFENNGVQVILKLSQYTNYPPESHSGDGPCGNSTVLTTKDTEVNESTERACVYLTRCNTAQYTKLEDYKKSYCTVDTQEASGYAGVCCLKTEIEST